jgi:hypothetical protein
VTALDTGDGPEVAGSYAGVRYEPYGASLDEYPSAFRSGPDRVIDFVAADGECPFPVHAPLTKRAVIEGVGGFDETMKSGAEDWDLWYRVLRAGYTFIPASLTSVVYRFSDAGMTRTGTREHVAASSRLINAANGDAVGQRRPGQPVPFDKPLGEYRRQIAVAERGLRFAAMAALDQRVEEARAIVEDLGITDWLVVTRHVDIPTAVRRAAYRMGRADLDSAQERATIDVLLKSIEHAGAPH